MRVVALFRRAVLLIGVRDAPARVDDHVATRQEAIGDGNGLIECAAWVVAQIEDQPLHAPGRQLLEGGADLTIRRLRELAELHVAGLRIDHERAADGRDVHFVANDFHVDQLVVAAPLDRDADGRALRTLEPSHRLLARPALGVEHSRLAGRIGTLDAGDDVAAAQTLLESGRALEDGHHGDVVVDDLNLDTEAVVLSFLALTHLGVGARIEETRVRIERLEHAVDRAVNEAL